MRDEYLASDSKAFEQYKKIQDDRIKFVYYHAFERRRAEEPLEIALAPFEKRVAIAAATLSQVKKDWEYVEKTITLAANTGELRCNQCYGLRRCTKRSISSSDATMSSLEAFIAQPGILKIDPSKNLLLTTAGSKAEALGEKIVIKFEGKSVTIQFKTNQVEVQLKNMKTGDEFFENYTQETERGKLQKVKNEGDFKEFLQEMISKYGQSSPSAKLSSALTATVITPIRQFDPRLVTNESRKTEISAEAETKAEERSEASETKVMARYKSSGKTDE